MVLRRHLLRAITLGIASSVAGCSGFIGGEEYDPGTLVVENRHSLAHVIEVRVVGGPTSSAVESELMGTFAVDAGETQSYPDFVTQNGRFEIEATLSSDGRTVSFAFNPADSLGDGSSGTYTKVYVDRSGQLGWTISTVD